MNPKKYFEIRLSLLQILLSLFALIGCFFFAFTMGAFMGSRFIQGVNAPPVAHPRQNLAAAPPVSDYNSLEPMNPPAGEAGKNDSDLRFYDELTQKVEITPSLTREGAKARPAAPAAPAATAAAPDRPAPPARKEAGYTIQVAAFQQKEKAYALANTLNSQGFQAQVISKTNPAGETWHRVRVGSFTSPEEAKQLLPQLGQLSSQPQITPTE